MRNSFKLFIKGFIFLSLTGYPFIGHTASISDHHVIGGKTLFSAVHAVVTRTIVIDYSPFPDLAGSVDRALIKDGETVALVSVLMKNPCPSVEKSGSVNSQQGQSKGPEVKILSQKTILCEGETGILMATGAASYSWSTGEQVESIRITPAFTSKYFVIGASKDGCKNVAYFIQQVEGCNGPQTVADDLHIFPNPSTGHFFVKVQSASGNLLLQIFNDFGKLIREEKIDTSGIKIDLTGEPDGMYLLRLIELGKEIQRKRLFKTP